MKAITRDYRYDLDGLRGVAIALVLLYHFGLLENGFQGVDMFLVLSGFVVSRRVMAALEDGTFSLLDFYARRAKRIIPASRLMMGLVCLFWFFEFPEVAEEQSRAGTFASLGLSNVYQAFVRPGGYFGAAAETDPLTHMWSLAVEEQFYLVWPLSLMALFQVSGAGQFQRNITLLMAVATMGSIAFCYWNSNAGYFMLVSRFGEFLAGVVALFFEGRFDGRPAVAEMVAMGGVVAIAAALVLVQNGTFFPGIKAFPVIIGSALLLVSGAKTRVAQVLQAKPLRYLGLVSYSLYLWHWPVLAASRYAKGALTEGRERLGLFLWSLSAACLSYFFVEQPVMSIKFQGSARQIVVFWVVPVLVVGLLFWAGPLYIAGSASAAPQVAGKNILKRAHQGQRPPLKRIKWCHDFSPECIQRGRRLKGNVTVLLIGDSQTEMLANWLWHAIKDTNRGFMYHACGGVLPGGKHLYHRKVQKTQTSACNKVWAMYARKPFIKTVVMTGLWSNPFFFAKTPEEILMSITAFVRQLVKWGKQVVLIGEIPTFKVPPLCDSERLEKRVLNKQCNVSIPVKVHMEQSLNRALQHLAWITPNVHYWDPLPYFCNERCHFLGTHVKWYVNGAHLSNAAIWNIFYRMMDDGSLPWPLEQAFLTSEDKPVMPKRWAETRRTDLV